MGVHAFPKGISSKVKVILRLEFKFASFEVAVQQVSHYTSHRNLVFKSIIELCNFGVSVSQVSIPASGI